MVHFYFLIHFPHGLLCRLKSLRRNYCFTLAMSIMDKSLRMDYFLVFYYIEFVPVFVWLVWPLAMKTMSDSCQMNGKWLRVFVYSCKCSSEVGCLYAHNPPPIRSKTQNLQFSFTLSQNVCEYFNINFRLDFIDFQCIFILARILDSISWSHGSSSWNIYLFDSSFSLTLFWIMIPNRVECVVAVSVF